jgi:hypothetical protein
MGGDLAALFAALLDRSPDTATAEDIRRLQLDRSETGAGIATATAS